MKLTRQQLDVVRRSVRHARKRGATPTEIRALIAGEGVESNFTELRGGDRDSTGALQQRPSMGWGPVGESLEKDVDQFLAHARQYRGKINDPGQLAQAVQRSAFPDRYGQRLGQADRLIRRVSSGGGHSTAGGGGSLGTPGTLVGGTGPKLVQGGTTTDNKAAMLAALMDHRKGMSLMDRFEGAVHTGNYTTTTDPSVTPGKAPYFKPGTDPSLGGSTAAGGGRLAKIKATADRIDAQHRPYLYGGGHNGNTGGPLDCSAAVSKVLGINVRVSGEFMKWGKPGRGKDLTVYANPEHVLVEIGGQFWGTSAANPQGGAGWIPAGHIDPAYLSKFTARHF